MLVIQFPTHFPTRNHNMFSPRQNCDTKFNARMTIGILSIAFVKFKNMTWQLIDGFPIHVSTLPYSRVRIPNNIFKISLFLDIFLLIKLGNGGLVK